MVPGHLETLETDFMSAANPPWALGREECCQGRWAPLPTATPPAAGQALPDRRPGAPERTAGPRAGTELGFPWGAPREAPTDSRGPSWARSWNNRGQAPLAKDKDRWAGESQRRPALAIFLLQEAGVGEPRLGRDSVGRSRGAGWGWVWFLAQHLGLSFWPSRWSAVRPWACLLSVSFPWRTCVAGCPSCQS